MVVDFGFKIYLPISDWTTNDWDAGKEEYTALEKPPFFWNPIYVSLGASYQMGDIGIAARIDLNFLGSVTYENKIAGPDVKLEIGLPFGLVYIGKTSVTVNDTERHENDKERASMWALACGFRKSSEPAR